MTEVNIFGKLIDFLSPIYLNAIVAILGVLINCVAYVKWGKQALPLTVFLTIVGIGWSAYATEKKENSEKKEQFQRQIQSDSVIIALKKKVEEGNRRDSIAKSEQNLLSRLKNYRICDVTFNLLLKNATRFKGVESPIFEDFFYLNEHAQIFLDFETVQRRVSFLFKRGNDRLNSFIRQPDSYDADTTTEVFPYFSNDVLLKDGDRLQFAYQIRNCKDSSMQMIYADELYQSMKDNSYLFKVRVENVYPEKNLAELADGLKKTFEKMYIVVELDKALGKRLRIPVKVFEVENLFSLIHYFRKHLTHC